jgi:hypothetical protein
VSNPPVFAGSPSGACSGVAHAPLVTAVVSAEIASTKSPAARVGSSLETLARSLLNREFDSQLDEHVEDVPLSVVHVRGEQEGEHGGGTGPRARCSPSRPHRPTRIAVDGSAARHALLRANFNRRCGLLNTRNGRRSVPPDKCDAVGEAVNRSTVA